MKKTRSLYRRTGKRSAGTAAVILTAALLFSGGCGSTDGGSAVPDESGSAVSVRDGSAPVVSVANAAENAAEGMQSSESEGTAGQEERDSETSANELQTREVFAMDTYMTFSAYGAEAEAALDEAEAEIMRLDRLLAAEQESSEVSELNQNGGGTVSEDVKTLVSRSLELHEMTGGAFEIAVYPVKKAWGFTDQNYRVPDEDTLKELLPLADSSLIEMDEEQNSVRFEKEGVEIDLGGIAKGYASSRLAEIFQKHNVKGMINLGGNVQVYGEKPDGSDWRVGIQAPDIREEELLPWLSEAASGSSALSGVELIGILDTHEQAVITSGGYERYFEQDGRIYHHIIDPETGYPSDSDILSSTIVSRDGTLADGLSTSVFVMGMDKATELWRADSGVFDMILMNTDGELYATDGLRGKFESELEIHWIS